MVDLAKLKPIPKLPDYFDPERGEPIPSDLLGSRIVNFGTADSGHSLSGGGLIVDYQPADAGETRRLVFTFDDTGMAIKFAGLAPDA